MVPERGSTKDNPLPRIILIRIVWPQCPMYPQIKRGLRRKNPTEYWRIKKLQNQWDQTFKAKMDPYRVGSYKDYEGGGWYVNRPLYQYQGKFYG